MQACDSIMFEYFCIKFIDFILNNKRLADATNLVSPNNLNINDEKILNIFNNLKLKVYTTTLNHSSKVKPDLSGSCL